MLGKCWENAGKIWWENMVKVKFAGNPMWLKLRLLFFVLKFFRKMANQTALLCQLCPPNKWQILEHSKKVTCTCQFPCSAHTHVTNQSCQISNAELHRQQSASTNCKFSSVSAFDLGQCWSLDTWPSLAHRRTKDLCNRFGTTDHSVPQFPDAKVKKKCRAVDVRTCSIFEMDA